MLFCNDRHLFLLFRSVTMAGMRQVPRGIEGIFRGLIIVEEVKMSREDFSKTPGQTEQDELSRFVDEAIASYRQKAEAEEQYESPVPVFDEASGHYVYQELSDEEEEEKETPDLAEEEEMQVPAKEETETAEKPEEKNSFHYEPLAAPAEEETAQEAESEALREQRLFAEANMPEKSVPSQIPNPLPVPRKKDHVELNYDQKETASTENNMDPEDDFDIEIDEDDDFDI